MKREWLRKGAAAVSEVVGAVVAAKGTNPIVAGLSLGAQAVSTYLDTFESPDPFADWSRESVPFNRQVREIIAPEITIVGDHRVAVRDLGGARIGWRVHDDYLEGPFSEGVCPLGRVADLVWEAAGDKLMLQVGVFGTTLGSDVLTDSLESGTAKDLAARLRPYIEAGHHRSVLLHGPPGTGKSHIMRCVSNLLGGRTLRINSGTLEDAHTVGEAIRFLSPTAVIVDDIDRADEPGKLLGHIEAIVQSSRLLLCSANVISGLPPAFTRVGRFSDVLEVKNLDPAVVAKTTENFPSGLRDRTEGLPISVLQEIRTRITVEGPDVDVEELINRTGQDQ